MQTFFLKSIYNILGSICIGNALWMLFSASSWFQKMPIAAEDTGPLNTHFVHDVGWVYLLTGMGALWCAKQLNKCFQVHLGITLFLAGHACIHIFEILTGALPTSHWLIDFPLVTLPAILLLFITPALFKINKLAHDNSKG